ncbi:TolC family protein [Pseudoxanthomonas suwonensis]|uniref:Cation transporter n=1 Tax=Pseudoxanthomonas suwonensis TaxID=314722 RepID=A0A0E3Z0Y7_9GAMM|nr:TolC family protein [Pseudoxanthomonas suwonensis]AKC86354.1 cation transporter [Pseudoxanthomonas suwonensis]
MWLRLAAVAAFAIAPCAQAQAPSPETSPETLALDDAFARVARAHPDLRLFGAQTEVLLAERDQAALKPALRAGLEVENALGTGAARGFDQAEITLSLAGVLERGGKLDARRALAQGRIDALSVQREAQRLDLLAETARRYLAVAGTQAQADITRLDIEQRRRTVDAARRRLQAGASPESVLLTAQAALAKAELALERTVQQEQAAMQHLAALWGQRDPDFRLAPSDPLRLPEIAGLDTLTGHLERTPELARFADAQRIGEARVRLARSAATPDLDWQLGVRRLQESGDTALVGSLSLPLGGTRRAQPEIRAAEAALAALEIERESQDVALYSTLVDAHGRYRVAQLEVRRTASDVLPPLAHAERAAERAYRAGAVSYLEWAQLQSERTATQRQQLDAALEARRALIEIQRLTGQPFVAGPGASEQGTVP